MGSQQQGTYSVFRSSIVNNNSNNNLTPIPFPDYNETICFSGDSKTTYKDVVYNSKIRKMLNYSIETLTNDSETTRLALRNKKKGMKKIPRPQNAWIIYRRDRHPCLEFGLKSSVASVIIGEMWDKEPNEVKEYYSALSMLALENHINKYGKEYKYKPSQRLQKSKISKKSKKQKENRLSKTKEENISPETMIPTPAASTQHSPAETQAFLPFNVTPSSPINEYLPTPATSIYSPVTSEDDLGSMESMNEYLPTPETSIYSPVTSEDDFGSMEPIDEYLSSLMINDGSSTTYQAYPQYSDILRTNEYLTPPTSNQHSPQVVLDKQFSEFMTDAAGLQFSEFMTRADTLATLSTIATNTEIVDFDLYSECEKLTNGSLFADTELTMNTENQFLQPLMATPIQPIQYDDSVWYINNDELIYPEQMDFYNSTTGHPSN